MCVSQSTLWKAYWTGIATLCVAAASLDPKRARQATEETRDAMFFKLNSYIEMLHAMQKIPWKHYSDIPSDCIYNMDELGNDTTKHRNKIIFKKMDWPLRRPAKQGHSCEWPRVMAACCGISQYAWQHVQMVHMPISSVWLLFFGGIVSGWDLAWCTIVMG